MPDQEVTVKVCPVSFAGPGARPDRLTVFNPEFIFRLTGGRVLRVGGWLTGVTVRVNWVLVVERLSLTLTVMIAVPN